jgi:adenosine deaminase
MPKVELHVHLQGATRPETLLRLAERSGIALPAQTVDGLREWYRFRDFEHFIEIYDLICECFRNADDIELAAREFLQGQAEQRILYTELTYTPNRRMPFDDQLGAINRAREWAWSVYGVGCGIVIDIPMEVSAADGLMIADWAISGMGRGVVGFGLGGGEGVEINQRHRAAFDRARAAGLPSVPHAGETSGTATIRGAVTDLGAVRLGHGVRCLEDPALVETIRERGIVLEVCPTSNVLLGVAPSLAQHPLPDLIAAGLIVTINTDDPPMFNTTLTEEYLRCAETFGWDAAAIEGLVMNAAQSTLLSEIEKTALLTRVSNGFAEIRDQASS